MASIETSKSPESVSGDLLLSPRDLADAIGASESSLRRWIDSGDIRISRTAGGHRRVPLREAVQFIRKIGAVVVRPEVLHLPPGPAPSSDAKVSDEQLLFAALRDGRRDVANGLALSWYLQGRTLHELFDGPMRGAMTLVGELWKHEGRGILLEHRATDICLALVASLRSLLPASAETAPLAIGGAPAGDPYQIPSLMAATVLAEAGVRDVNFGPGTPLDLLAAEAALTGAKLVWVSVSAVSDAKALRAAIKRLAGQLSARNVELVIGGHGSADVAPRAAPNVHPMRSLGELAAFARGLAGRAAAAG
jgi:methanogenic corrinoid protein MtbC1